MGRTKSAGCAALALIAVFGVSGIPAQTGSEASAGAHTPEAKPGNGSAVVSVDILRHPVNAKIRKLLLRAMEKTDSGEHEAAIGQLLEILRKYPDSAPYVHNLLGVEYVKTGRFQTAVSSFEQAISWLPHDAMTHYNFGLALVCAGDYRRAAQEVQRALELDPNNGAMRVRLNALGDHGQGRQ
jgi:tetratricopeptide (TPR) repeat protein